MSTLTMMISRVLVVVSVMAAMLMMPKPVFAADKAPKVVVSEREKATKWAGLSRAARAKIQRAKMAGLSVAANTGFAVALTAGAIYDAVQHNATGVMLLGGFATYNGIQAYRKWRTEKVMMEAE